MVQRRSDLSWLCPPTRLPTYPPTHLPTHSPTHLLTYSPTQLQLRLREHRLDHRPHLRGNRVDGGRIADEVVVTHVEGEHGAGAKAGDPPVVARVQGGPVR